MSEAGTGTTPVVFVHGLWLHADSWEPGSTSSAKPATRRSRRAGRATPSTIEETRSASRARRRARHRRRRRALRRESSRGLDAKPIVDRPLLRRPRSSSGCSGEDLAVGGGRDRPRADQRRPRPAAVGAPGRVDRAAEPGQQEARGLADARSSSATASATRVSAAGVGRALRTLDDPFAGEAAVRGRARRTSRRTRRRRSTPSNTTAGRCSSPPAARTTPSRRRSASRRSSSTASRRR